MTLDQAHQVIVDAINVANVKGTYNLQEVSTILEAIRVLKPQEQELVKEEKKWLFLIFVNELQGLGGDVVGHGFIIPESFFTARHITNPADAIDDCHVMAVARFGTEKQFRI